MLALLLNQPVFVVCKSKVVSPHTLTCTRTRMSLILTILDGTYIYKESSSNTKITGSQHLGQK